MHSRNKNQEASLRMAILWNTVANVVTFVSHRRSSQHKCSHFIQVYTREYYKLARVNGISSLLLIEYISLLEFSNNRMVCELVSLDPECFSEIETNQGSSYLTDPKQRSEVGKHMLLDWASTSFIIMWLRAVDLHKISWSIWALGTNW